MVLVCALGKQILHEFRIADICRKAAVAVAEGEKKKISVTSKGAVVEANAVLKPGDML